MDIFPVYIQNLIWCVPHGLTTTLYFPLLQSAKRDYDMRHCLLFESIPYIPYWCHQSSLVHRVCFNLHLKTVLHKTIPSLQSEMCYKLQCPAVFYGHLAFTNTESVRPIFFKDKHLEEEQVGYRH